MICFNNICISTIHLILIVIIVSIIIYYYLKIHDFINDNNKILIDKIEESEKKLFNNTLNNTSDTYNKLPINMTTRPSSTTTQIGLLYKHDIANTSVKPGDNDTSVVLPLFGRTLYSNSSKWIYYTMMNSMKIPIYYKGIQCDKELGCTELYVDDIINIPALNGNFKVFINEVEQIRYIPFN